MARKKVIKAPHLNETKCRVCGKSFFPTPSLHVYKDRRNKSYNVCSYNCVLKSQRLKDEAAERRKALLEQKKAGGKA